MAFPLPGTPIILDIGSAYVKIGFAGEPAPRFVFPCITGYEKYKSVMVDVGQRSVYVGNDAMKMRGVLKVKYPLQRGVIMDWEEYYEILNYIFYTLLRIDNLSNYPVMYAEHPFMPRETKEYIARVLFETHRVRSLIMLQSPFLSMFSVGITTGLVLESGDGVTWIVPIVNGQIYHQAIQKLNLAGIDVNHNLKSLMMREGINIESSAADEILKEIKEKNCYFVIDPNNPPVSKDTYTYPMPDGSVKQIPNNILHQAPEIMFQPGMLGYNMMNIPQAIIYCLQMMDSAYWYDLLSHIVLSGGNLMYSGFEERLKQEVITILPQLGNIPRPQRQPTLSESYDTRLEAIETTQKIQDTCSKCGALVDLSDGKESCPLCGASMKLPQLSIDLGGSGDMISSSKRICPFCNKGIKDDSSIFCPYCGKNIQMADISTTSEKIMEEAMTATEFKAEFNASDEIIKFLIPENLQYAVFYGASILGSLPSFQNLFITHEEFQANTNVLYRDISDVFR
ncbi:MAG: hypothetical protein ACFE8A_04020 [Candidatus Hodarchaeota archaeon]